MKILTILGARPQFIKASSVSREIKKYLQIEEVIVHTGQHYDTNMSDIFFEQMHIPKPNYFLGIGGATHGAMTGQMIERIEEVVLKENPDIIMVYGDTNSTLAGAIVASKLNIKLAHIEAGLRSFNMKMPEEVNRILTDRVSTYLFCPTDKAVENLYAENYQNTGCNIIKSGDVMLDGALFYKEIATQPNFDIMGDFVLCTIHRAENTNDINRLRNIIESLDTIAEEIKVILPLHPRTSKIIKESAIPVQNITITEPVGYLEMVWLLKNCTIVMTDSGGLQKEAYFFSKPCVTLRDETEWEELVDVGANILTGTDKSKILEAYHQGKNKEIAFSEELYGRGDASGIIIKELLK
ncbi:non-hydrolyzing UDP-N-acetylglucosamine 2-epimerase [Chryseobacterium camelliae]|uniref:non-hydrolyzing UDP-N-acetylglucosamine 2-epimerase n=1 Tax=Chryseobacterium camelliae TaxID=1265445 RepID=UPI000C1CB430|nr:UDP-N-acetylglucosamine 2-epimerase (non-hydrolyzing) [Chryseobacterium camelliae]